MRLKHKFALSTTAGLLASLFGTSGASSVGRAQSLSRTQSEAVLIAPAPIRVTEPVNDRTLVTLKGNTHPLAQARYDSGRAPGGLATGGLQLLLRRSPAQQAALRQYLNSLQDPHSPGYHRWLTPAAYGARFGISDQDLQTVENWLRSEGFQIQSVPAGRNFVRFSGTADQLTRSFHTSIHSYTIHGEQHYSNATDPSIPAALAPVVAGVSPLNDFRAQPQQVSGNAALGQTAHGTLRVVANSSRIARPLLIEPAGNPAGPALYVTPADAATIYNAPNGWNSRYKGAAQQTGAGVNIGLAEYSNLQTTDYANYRKLFLNESAPLAPTLVADGVDPGVQNQHDGQVTLIDTEIAAGLAPGAHIYVYSSKSDFLEDGLTSSILRAIEDNDIAVLAVSYATCEASLGASGNLEISELWQQAAAQGISVVVAAGDSGAAGCDDGASHAATNGLAVSGLASTPYDIAVGGTDFDTLNSAFQQYVSGGNPDHSSAAGYIPENPWNDSIDNNPPGSFTTDIPALFGYGLGIVRAGGGGQSSAAVCASGMDPATGNCTGPLTGYPAPPFQSAVNPGKTASVRSLPDVALFSGDMIQHPAGWAICSDNLVAQASYTFTDCTPAADGTFSVEGAGGTATPTAAFAGILGMVIESLGANTRLGAATNVLYNLHAGGSAGAVFHDITAGNNAVPCTGGSPDCGANSFLSGYDAGPGYDLATGLGSVDISALIAAWPTAAFTPTTTSIAANGDSAPITVNHGDTVTLAATVTPATATGAVSITSAPGQGGAAVTQLVPLTGGAGSISTRALPGGDYTVQGYYPGDVNHSPSSSAPPIQITVAPEDSRLLLSLIITDVDTGRPLPSSFTYGSYGFVYVQPQSVSGSDGVATGTADLQNNGADLGTQPLNSRGRAVFPIANLAPGAYSLNATYSGDRSYNRSATTADTALSIAQAPTQLSAAPVSSALSPSDSAQVTVTLATDSAGAFPTGGITLSGNGKTFPGAIVQSLDKLNAVQEAATFTIPGSALAAGQNKLVAVYAGDANYLGSTAAATITVPSNGSNGPGFTLAGPSAGIVVPSLGTTATGAIAVTPTNGFTGVVKLSCTIAAANSTDSANPPTCSVTPSVSLAAYTAENAVLTIQTGASNQALVRAGTPNFDHPLTRSLLGRAAGAALCSIFLLASPARRRRSVLLSILTFGALTAMGCGVTIHRGAGGAQTGTFTATVTGAGGSATASTQIEVRVQ